MRRVQLLAALAVAPAFVQCQLLRELIDVRLLEVQYAIPLGDHRVVRRDLGVTHGHLAHQAFGQRAQLLRVQVIQGCGTHGRQYAARLAGAVLASCRIAGRYSTEIAPAAPTWCQGRPSTSACHCSLSSAI